MLLTCMRSTGVFELRTGLKQTQQDEKTEEIGGCTLEMANC